jgi:outer membrane receptor protein involved in Fe transport
MHAANNQIKQLTPETTHSYEIELGYQFQRNLGFTVNFFYNQINDFFVYSLDANNDDFYQNSDRHSTWGAEAMLSYQHRNWGQLKVNYGFYQALEDTSSLFKAVDSDDNIVHEHMNISFPTHKVSLNHIVPITQSLSFNHTLIFSSDRYGYSGNTLIHHDPTWIYNTYFRYQNALVTGLEVGLGVYDVFNAQYEYVQLVNGSHPALPGNTRELRLKLSYEF